MTDAKPAPMIWVIADKITGKEFAFHGENGPTLHKWFKDLVRIGYNVEIRQREQRKR